MSLSWVPLKAVASFKCYQVREVLALTNWFHISTPNTFLDVSPQMLSVRMEPSAHDFSSTAKCASLWIFLNWKSTSKCLCVYKLRCLPPGEICIRWRVRWGKDDGSIAILWSEEHKSLLEASRSRRELEFIGAWLGSPPESRHPT